jgi:hypothetical protein
MSTNEDVAMWFGGCCGVLVSLFFFLVVISTFSDPKIQQCELELPRNQKCILIAVPKVTEDN